MDDEKFLKGEKTTIQVYKYVRDALNSVGHRGETYSDIIMRLVRKEKGITIDDVKRSLNDKQKR